MSVSDSEEENSPSGPAFKRRVRYSGKHPQNYAEKYKELDPELDPKTIAKVIAAGKTPAGQHRPILVDEVLQSLAPRSGERGADVTLGYGGHSEAILGKLFSGENSRPGGQLLALDVDPIQLPRTEQRLRDLGYGEDELIVRRSNYAGLAAVIAQVGWDDGVDFLLADLGLSSMQIDNPARGFSYKHEGPLDMRMNPERGVSARDWLARCKAEKLVRCLEDGGDEPRAETIAAAITAISHEGRLETTRQLRRAVEKALPETCGEDERKATVARVFQAIRIAVNEEFTALDAFLTRLPDCLRAGGRVVMLTFHSGEDRRVKHHFRDGHRSGLYSDYAREIVRPSSEEIGGNPRAAPAKMRWAVRT
jgi:16S rRNA (cytosine1402-N4)-methyltransferase